MIDTERVPGTRDETVFFRFLLVTSSSKVVSAYSKGKAINFQKDYFQLNFSIE